MHIIIGLITAIAGLIWALNSLERSGFRWSSINPFYWHRRNKWKKQYQESPLYALSEPMEVAAVVMLGVAKLEGEISREQKKEILKIFNSEFNLDEKSSSDLFASTSYLLQSENNFLKNIDKVLARSKDSFSEEQAESTIALAERIAKLDSNISHTQQELLNSFARQFHSNQKQIQKW